MDNITHLNMAIVKASRIKETGEMKLRMVNSDTGEDVFGEKMSIELFNDFIRRSEGNMKVPAPFDKVIDEEGYWEGGAPYLSIAHYKSGAGKNVPGEQEKLYLDGDKLKSVDTLYDTDLGKAVWKSVYNDLYVEEKDFENPVRVSIGFLDLEHKHTVDGEDHIFTRKTLKDRCEMCADGIENKTYLKGHLVHKAFTRKPAHPRTNVEIEMKSDDITTREEDAKSIIGEIELEKKSQVDEVLVVKDNEEVRDPEPEETMEKIEQEEQVVEPVVEPDEVKATEEVVEEVIEEVVEPVVEPVKSAVAKASQALESKMAELKEKGVYGDEALAILQPFYNEMGNVLKAEVEPKGEAGDIANVIRSTIQSIIPELKESIVAEVVRELSGFVAQPSTKPVAPQPPVARSLTIQKALPTITPEGQKQKSQLQRIAEASVQQ